MDEAADPDSGPDSGLDSESDAEPDADSRAGAALAADALSVRELNERLAGELDGALSGVRCHGEVSDLAVRSTAVYFDLVGEEASVNCFCWRSRYDELDADLADGDEVVLEGQVSYYVERGRVNLRPWRAWVLGDGETATALRELRAELEDRGWFDDAHKTAPPRHPRRVGLVTSTHGDARHDVSQAIHDRDPGVDLVLRHAAVQGDGAPDELADAIHRLDRHADVDAIVVGRGGGSDTDLRAFDDEAVAEAIFTAETPVVAAVGHREDETVAGAVADARAITPTDAGEAVVADRETVRRDVAERADRLERAYEAFVEEELAELEARLEAIHDRHAAGRLADLERRLTAAGDAFERTRDHREQLRAQRARARRYRRVAAVLAVLLAVTVALLLWTI